MADNIFTGIAFPFRKGTTSFPEGSVDDRLIREELMQLLLTARGERVMRPELGTDAQSFVFETNDELLASNIRTVVANAIAKFEPRILLRAIDVERAASGPDRLDNVIITVSYVVPATQQQGEVSVQIGQNPGPAE